MASGIIHFDIGGKMCPDESSEIKRLQRSVKELSVLNEIAKAINISMSLNEITRIIIDKCAEQLEAEQGAIFLLSEEDSLADDFKTFIRTRDDQSQSEPIHLNRSITGWMMTNREILISNDLELDCRFSDADILKKNIKSLIAVPLLIKGSLIGLMTFFNKSVTQGFDENDKRFISILSSQVAKVIENAHLYERETKFINMVQSQRIKAVSRLVAGLAHELNNPVGAIGSSINVIKRTLQNQMRILDSPDLKTFDQLQKVVRLIDAQMESVHVIENGSSRIAGIVKRLREFTQLDQSEFKGIDINDCVKDCLAMFSSPMIKNINFVKEFGKLPEITCHVAQINQVIFNILLNSIEAVCGEGIITIRTFVRDESVILEIEDSGSGISTQIIDKIIDPGFTTKGVGVGTGLGLAICYQIVKSHNGELKIESEVDKYTKVEVSFPIINRENKNILQT